MAAKGRQAGDDRVADLHRAHFAADRLDDARGFMAGDRGEGVRIGAVDEMQIRMAKPARDGADPHLVRVAAGDNDPFELLRLARLDQYRSEERRDGTEGDSKCNSREST